MSSDSTEGGANSELFIRTPQVSQMRDPLKADWNVSIGKETGADAQTAPEAGETDLASLIDFGQINQVFQNFLEVVGLPVAILNLKAKVLASSRWQRVCMDFHRVNEQTLSRCLESDISLSRQMQEGKNYAIYRCRNGLTDCATPIVIEGKHIANLFIGQFFVAQPDLEFFRNQAREFGFPEEDYLKAISEAPIVAEEKLPSILNFLTGFAHLIATQSLAQKRAMQTQAKIEKEVENRTRELIALNKELEAFSYSVSHDLMSPLRAIDGFTKYILQRHGEHLPEDARSMFDMVLTGVSQMTKLIGALLEFGRMRHSEMKTIVMDMGELARTVINEMKPSIQGRDVVFEVGDLPPSRVDGIMLHQVLANLISNAIKFTKNRDKAVIKLGAARDGPHVIYSVSDNGVGFDMAYSGRLFDVFQRLHSRSEFEGSGVGLALVRRIIERHGGRVWAESELDKGTTIFFTIPDLG
ncbi:MAG: PocR ligand-binding domain-containing protein [Nitrospinae bacterium]|nr:PocR ligand-binding domain-containing protein [Nitrospinota bacterium]